MKRIAKRLIPAPMWQGMRMAARRVMLSGHIPPMAQATRRKLVDQYRADISELGQLTGRELGHWLR